MSFLTQGSQGAAWRAASAALAPLAASSSASQTLVCALNVAHVCVLTGMFRAHVNNFATRSRAQRAYFSSPHSRRSPRRSPPCSARPRACGRSLYAMENGKTMDDYRHRSPNRSLTAQQMPTPLGGALSICTTATMGHHNKHHGGSWLIGTTRNCLCFTAYRQ